MKKYMLSIIEYYEEELKKEGSDKEKLSAELLTRIQFMQHERFIHLIVTVLFSLILFNAF